MVMRKVMKGQLLPHFLMTPSRRANHSLFSRSNLSSSCGSRAKALTTRMPVRLSCMTVDSTPICSWMLLNIGSMVRPKRRVVMSRMGSGMSASSASGTDWSSMAATTPTSSSSVASRSIRPMPTKRSDSAMSPVARLIRSPVWL